MMEERRTHAQAHTHTHIPFPDMVAKESLADKAISNQILNGDGGRDALK